MDHINTEFDKYTKVWSGPKSTKFFDPDCSIGKVLFAFMRNNAGKICQVSEQKNHKFRYKSTHTHSHMYITI